jgi:hypothetical protein
VWPVRCTIWGSSTNVSYVPVWSERQPARPSPASHLPLCPFPVVCRGPCCQGQTKEATALFERAIAIFNKSLGDDNVEVATVYFSLGSILDDADALSAAEAGGGLDPVRVETAIAYQKKALTSIESVDRFHPNVATYLHELARLYELTGRRVGQPDPDPKAMAAAAAADQKAGVVGLDKQQQLNRLNKQLWAHGNTEAVGTTALMDATVRTKKKAAVILRSPSPPPATAPVPAPSPKPVSAASGAASAAATHTGGTAANGPVTQAEYFYRAALGIRRALFGDSHTDTMRVLDDLGQWLWRLNENLKAAVVFDELLKARAKTVGEGHAEYRALVAAIGLVKANRPFDAAVFAVDSGGFGVGGGGVGAGGGAADAKTAAVKTGPAAITFGGSAPGMEAAEAQSVIDADSRVSAYAGDFIPRALAPRAPPGAPIGMGKPGAGAGVGDSKSSSRAAPLSRTAALSRRVAPSSRSKNESWGEEVDSDAMINDFNDDVEQLPVSRSKFAADADESSMSSLRGGDTEADAVELPSERVPPPAKSSGFLDSVAGFFGGLTKPKAAAPLAKQYKAVAAPPSKK